MLRFPLYVSSRCVGASHLMSTVISEGASEPSARFRTNIGGRLSPAQFTYTLVSMPLIIDKPLFRRSAWALATTFPSGDFACADQIVSVLWQPDAKIAGERARSSSCTLKAVAKPPSSLTSNILAPFIICTIGPRPRTPERHPSPCRIRHTPGLPQRGSGGSSPPRNQEPDRHPQTARPRHTPARPTPKPTAKEKTLRTSGNRSAYDPHPLPDRKPWPPRNTSSRHPAQWLDRGAVGSAAHSPRNMPNTISFLVG